MSSTSTYNSDRQSSVDIEFCADPASGSFFSADYKKHDDLKQMLDGNKDSLKLEAMKRIISMVAKGKDASELFPAVVKNVVSSNLEVKKLVYLYLVRYAEEQQDLALLSISTFQRALKDPNPLIRACALRVLSSIRVQVIVPIMMLAIKETVMDLSPYVRKATSHAIPKLYSLDPEQKDELVKVIEKLLSDMSTLVVGSAVMAFEEVCPERIDLIHTNYRKLCCMLVDVEEWGQVIIINMLTRYSRTQFVDPNEGIQAEEIEEKPFYEEDEVKDEKKDEARMDPDHRLLLVNTKPLLLSRNAAVVLAVGQLYQHIGPHAEVAQVAKALVRLLRSHREVQFVVLTNIASLSTQRKGMFEPLLKSFFVRSRDPTQIKVLKLEVMTNIANQTNISLILREFQTYIWSPDKEFVAATIQAIGRCASNIKEVTDTCLSGLVSLLSNKDELVVGESVVVVRKLLQSETVGHKDIITHMARLVDGIKMPTARASILWLLGEYCDKVPKIAPDVLRKMAKSFVNEADMVKLQILTLATKLYLTNPKQTHLLCQYVLNMAKYDNNYDIRDRARFVRALIFPRTDKEEDEGKFSLAKHAHNIFLAPKSAPIQYSNFKERNHLQLGTLSHLINAKATGYTDLPEFPSVAPDPTVRNLKEQVNGSTEKEFHATKTGRTREKLFYSDDEAKNSESESASSDSESDDSSDSDSEMTAGSDSDTASEIEVPKKNTLLIETAKDAVCSSSSSAEDSEDGSTTSASDSSDSDVTDAPVETKQTNSLPKKTRNKSPPSKSNLDLLLDLDIGNISIETPVLTPSMGGFLTPNSSKQDENGGPPGSSIKDVSAAYIPVNSVEILNRIAGNGLSVNVRFSRSPHLYSSSMTSIELAFTNHGKDPIKEISLGAKRLTSGMSLHEFSPIPSLGPGSTLHGTIGIDFKDSISSANFDIKTADQSFPVSVTPSIGELITPVTMNVADFKHFQNKLRGMNEHIGEVTIEESTGTESQITSRIFNKANVSRVSESSEGTEFWFAGKTCSEKNLVLISVHVDRKDRMKICVNSEKMMVASILFKHLESAFAK